MSRPRRRTEFLVSWPVQGEFHFKSASSELVLSDVYWLWIYRALLEVRDDGQQLPFVKAAEVGFRDPENLVETIPVSSRFLELLQQIPPSLAPSFDKLETSDGSLPPKPEQILTELVRLVREALAEGTIEMAVE